MRNTIIGIVAMASTVALVAAGLSLAASHVKISVVNPDGGPVVGAAVDVITSDGVMSGTTGADGAFTTSIAGKYFRIRVDNVPSAQGFEANDSPVTIVVP